VILSIYTEKKIVLKQTLILCLGLVISPLFLFSQGQTDWWYFGVTAGVHFNTSPSAVTNGAISTSEGVATISDAAGNLLFYSDGITVKNANHVTMTNGTGLLGGGSSAQSGVVVPKPGSATDYYLFTVAPFGSTNGLRYTHIDMTQSSGLGAVNNAQKNVFLMGQPTEKIAVVPKSGGYWVMTAKHTSDTMYVYSVTSAGVNMTPVKSATGVYTANPQGSVSYLKPNLAGTRLVGGAYGAAVVALYDFNKATGVASNGFTFAAGTATHANYGVEFSPNGNLVYAQGWGSADTRQYNVNAGNAAAIAASVTLLGPSTSGSGGGGGAIQLGRDGMLYVCRYGQTYLDRIANPDVAGTGAGYSTSAVSLSSRTCRWGLPTFIQAFFGASIEVVDNCYGDSTYFTADTAGVDSMYWYFGDTLSGSNNFGAGLESVAHLYTDTGLYTVSLVIYGSGGLVDTINHDVYIYPRQFANLGFADTSLCIGVEFTIDVSQEYATYEWHDGSTDSAYTVSYPDSLIIVTVTGICDTVVDSAIVNYFYPFVVDIQDDTGKCTYDTVPLTTGLPTSVYQHNWSNGSTQNHINASQPGTYMVTVTEGICVYSDTVVIVNYPEVKVDLGNDSSFCYEPLVTLTPRIIQNVSSYNWSTGATTATLPITQSDVYTVTASGTNGFCHDVDSVRWDLWFEPTVHFKEGDDTSFCHNEIFTIDPVEYSSFPVTYLWNDNSNNPDLNINLIGLYWVEVSDENCSTKDTIIINQYPILEVDLGQDLKVCEGGQKTITPITTIPVANYLWNDGSTSSTLKVSEHGTYTVSVDNDLCYAHDDINVFYFEYPLVDLGSDTAICPGSYINLDATSQIEDIEYLWSSGDRGPTQTYLAKDSVFLWVKVNNAVCQTIDSIFMTVRDVPNMYLGNDTTICEGDEIEIAVLENATIESYAWSTTESAQSVRVKDSADYEVTVFDGHCHTAGNIRVDFVDQPTDEDVKLDVPSTICLGQSVPLNVYDERFSAYEWQDGTTSSSYTITSEGIYRIKATHKCGVVTDTVLIEKCECPIWLPTAFNPDGDEMNDRFLPISDCRFIQYEFSIYDRWGEQVFFTEDPTESWSGEHLGSKADGGAYGWKLIYTADAEGKIVEDQLNGKVLLIR